jgi:hypothetical protein
VAPMPAYLARSAGLKSRATLLKPAEAGSGGALEGALRFGEEVQPLAESQGAVVGGWNVL